MQLQTEVAHVSDQQRRIKFAGKNASDSYELTQDLRSTISSLHSAAIAALQDSYDIKEVPLSDYVQRHLSAVGAAAAFVLWALCWYDLRPRLRRRAALR